MASVRRAILTAEKKKQVLAALAEGTLTNLEICKKFRVSSASIWHWKKEQANGSNGNDTNINAKRTATLKRLQSGELDGIRDDLAAGMKLPEIAAKYGVSESTVYKFRSRTAAEASPPAPKEVHTYSDQAKKGIAKVILYICDKDPALFAELEIIERISKKYPHLMIEALSQ